ncbi:MAG: hypothetical protein V1758_04070, partial [Pseudomonadota bacterium]
MSWIHRINRLDRLEKEGLYRILIAPSLYRLFRIDPLSLSDERGVKAVRFFCPKGDRTCLIEMKPAGDVDPVYSFQLSDSTDAAQIEWDFLVVNDPRSPKFNTHIDQEGRDTLFGWASRNLGEEERAMEAGLFPGQIRKGLRLTGEVIRALEFLCR